MAMNIRELDPTWYYSFPVIGMIELKVNTYDYYILHVYLMIYIIQLPRLSK